MGRSALTILALLLFTSCVDTVSPDVTRRGRYTLAHVNGDALPMLFVETPFARLYFLRGELVLNADDTFSDITDMRREPKQPGLTTSLPSDTTRGTYEMAGDTIIFSSIRGDVYRMTFQSSGSLVQELAGNKLTYRK